MIEGEVEFVKEEELKRNRSIGNFLLSVVLFCLFMFVLFYSIDVFVAMIAQKELPSVADELYNITHSVPAAVASVLLWRQIMSRKSCFDK